ncbi:YesK family protein, partial [Pseudogracilibacillus sp. ICA-222130]|uniref:YesK family protein n=1 Tax=Pseudogracilibacillus sp. ICA-222130 TaxID=3134655 RepID=UPI0030C2E579
LFFIMSIILLSFLTKKTEIRVMLPIVIFLISIILFLISLTVGAWVGMGLGYISLSLFVSSIISLIVIVIIDIVKKDSL